MDKLTIPAIMRPFLHMDVVFLMIRLLSFLLIFLSFCVSASDASWRDIKILSWSALDQTVLMKLEGQTFLLTPDNPTDLILLNHISEEYVELVVNKKLSIHLKATLNSKGDLEHVFFSELSPHSEINNDE